MATRSALAPVQILVFTTLDGDNALKALTPVFDHIPATQAFPWLLLTDFVETLDNTLGEEGRAITIGIDCWSEVEGYKELQDIAEELIRLLNTDTLANPAGGWVMDYCLYKTGRLDRETDGLTRHGRFEFDMVVHR